MDVSDSMDWNQELIEEYVDEHPHEENRSVTYLGLVRGNTYALKQQSHLMKKGDHVIALDFEPTNDDSKADVLVRHALYGTYWVNHRQLEEIDNNNLVKEALIALLCNRIVECMPNLGHSKEEAKKIQDCANLLVGLIDE